MTSLASKQCLAVPSGAEAGARVALEPCDGPDASTAWELQGDGQIKLGSSNMCLSQSRPAPGNADLAASSSVIASSTLDPAHGAALAVDGLDSSFWVSKLDELSPVTLTVELDEPAPVLEVGLDFEFVPSVFFIANLKRRRQVDRRVCHGHQCPQDDSGSTDWSFCAWCQTSYEESSCN